MQTIKSILEKIHEEEVNRHKNGETIYLLDCIKKGLVGKEMLTVLIGKRYQLSHMFEEFLEHVMKVVKQSKLPREIKDGLYEAAHQNYLEEKGTVIEYGGPHSEGRETLLMALGYDYDKWQQPLGTYENPGAVCEPVRVLLTHLREIVARGPIEAITALWCYENRISLDGYGDYFILLHGFENAFPQFKKASLEDYKEGDVFWHLASHAHHDTYHAQLAVDGLNLLPGADANVEKITTVCRDMKHLFDTFWNSLATEIELK